MKQIELFYLTYCPYCINARKAVGELKDECPAYRPIRIRWIEETEEAELAASRDYYYVPTLFCGGEKLYEARPGHDYARIKENIRRAFETVLAAPEET